MTPIQFSNLYKLNANCSKDPIYLKYLRSIYHKVIDDSYTIYRALNSFSIWVMQNAFLVRLLAYASFFDKELVSLTFHHSDYNPVFILQEAIDPFNLLNNPIVKNMVGHI